MAMAVDEDEGAEKEGEHYGAPLIKKYSTSVRNRTKTYSTTNYSYSYGAVLCVP